MSIPISADEFLPTGVRDQRKPRQSRLVKARLECPRLGRFSVTIRNISETGIGVTTPYQLSIGERLTIHLPEQPPTTGTVRWVIDRRCGIETDQRIKLDALRATLGGRLLSVESSVQFPILPPVQCDERRPGLSRGSDLNGRSKGGWTNG